VTADWRVLDELDFNLVVGDVTDPSLGTGDGGNDRDCRIVLPPEIDVRGLLIAEKED
jgi:hypothetical protein